MSAFVLVNVLERCSLRSMQLPLVWRDVERAMMGVKRVKRVKGALNAELHSGAEEVA